MKKFLAVVLAVALMLSVVPAFACVEPLQPGWWVKEQGRETGEWTNIQDDVDSLIQQYCEEYCIPGPKGDKGDPGADGKDGAKGDKGDTGIGIAEGGTTGQVLGKLSNEDYDTGWIDVLTPDDLASALEPIENWMNTSDQRFDRIENRLDTLEETQFILGLNVRLLDTKRTTLEAFADYSTNRSKVDRCGIRLTLKLGKSYEEKLIEQLQAQIAELMAKQ